jgi:hypothetical protein
MGRAAHLPALRRDAFSAVFGTGRGMTVQLPSGNHLRMPDDNRWIAAGLGDHRGQLRHDASPLLRFVHTHADHDGFRAVRGAESVPGQAVPAAPAGRAFLGCYDHGDEMPRLGADLEETEALFRRLGISFDKWPPPRDEWSRWPR